jgi:hypothetical protein
VAVVAAQGLGITELWATRFEEARRDLGRSVTLAQQIGQPYATAWQCASDRRRPLAAATWPHEA